MCGTQTFYSNFCINYCCEILLGGLHIPKSISQQKFMQNLGGRGGGKQTELWAIDLFTDTAAILNPLVSSSYYGMLRGQIHKLPPVKPWSQGWLIAAGAYPGFCSMKRLEAFLLPLDGMLVHRRSLPRNFVRFPQQIAGTHLYTWVERGTVRVKCLAQEHNTLSPTRARTRTAR